MIQNRRTIEQAAPGALFSFAYPFAITWRSLSNFARFGWIAPVAMLVVFLLAVLDNQSPGEGEPFSWTSGVSAWPTQLLRVLTIGLAIGFLLRGEEDLRRNQLELSRRFILPDGDEQRRPCGGNRISEWLHSAVAVRARNALAGISLARTAEKTGYTRPLHGYHLHRSTGCVRFCFQ